MNAMRLTILILAIILGSTNFTVQCQTPIDITERTFRLSGLGGEEVFYFGFSEGDQIVFNFNVYPFECRT